jgi:hypothetical protein
MVAKMDIISFKGNGSKTHSINDEVHVIFEKPLLSRINMPL